STVPAGSLAKASSVGAKTVNGPGLLRVSTRPPALTAATRVLLIGELTAFSTMVLLGYISAPPTVGFFCAWALSEVMAMAATARAERKVFFIVVILLLFLIYKTRPDFRALTSIYVRVHRLDCLYFYSALKFLFLKG